MPYHKTSSSLEHNFAAKLEICKIIFKSSLTTSLIAGILSLSSLGKVAQATNSTKEAKKTSDNGGSLTVSKTNLNAENKSKTATFSKNSNSVGSIETLIANLSSLPSVREYSANISISNRTDVKLGSTSIEHKVNLDREFDSILANQNLVTSSDFRTSLAANPKSRIHVVSPGETISKIARQYGVSKDDLVKLNQLKNSNVIFVSQRLKIPTKNILASTKLLPNTLQQSRQITSSVAVEVANKEPDKSISSLNQNSDRSVAEEDPYIAKLKVDIEQLRNQKPQNLREPNSALENSNSSSDRVRPARENAPAKIETVSVATVREASDSQPSLLLKDSIALQLPPLPPSDEYLPSAFDGYIWPTQGILTSGYGWRWGRMHRGIDIAAPIGTPIVAAASGEVINVGWQSGYGNVIKLKHLDGSVTVYGHNHKNLVIHGQKVEQGEQIAEMGNTGRSTGPHLHFEIRLEDTAINPLALLGDR